MSCFVNENIAGSDNVTSLLNEELKTIFPLSIAPGGASKHYVSLRRDGGAYKNMFPVDWETQEGQDYINKYHPGFLNEQGEPKLFIDKVGRAYFKQPDGVHYINKSVISENERRENIKAIMASYVENDNVSLKQFIKDSMQKNMAELDAILYRTESKIDELMTLFSKKGISQEEKNNINKEITYLENDVIQLNKNLDFLLSASTNKELADIIFNDVKSSLESAKIAYEDDAFEREKNMNEASMDLGFLRPSNEVNPENNISPEIMKLVSTIPKVELKFDENGDISGYEKSVSNLMPLLTYIYDYKEVTNELQKVLKDTVAIDLKFTPEDIKGASQKKLKEKYAEELRKANLFDTMYDSLSQYAEASNSNIVTQLLINLDKLIESKSPKDQEDIKAKFVKSFHKAKSNNVMHTTGEGTINFGPNKGKDMINVNKIDLSNENTRAEALTGEMLVKSLLKLNSAKTKKETDEINQAAKNLYSSRSFFEDSVNLKKYLELRYGMVLHDKTISQLISHINKGPVATKNNTKITDFLRNMNEMSSLQYMVSDIITKGKKKGGYTLSKLAKDYFKSSSSDKEIIINNFVSNGGVPTEFRKIAELEYNNNPTSADSSIAVGSKKMWMYSFMSKMQKDILTWKNGDLSSLEILKDTGNGMVDFLLGKESDGTYNTALSQKRINGISLKNNVELRQKLDSNPETFNSLTEEDLLLMTYTNLYENKKEMYVEREQGGSDKTGGNVELANTIAARDTANEFVFLNNSDKTQTLSFAGILRGDSNVTVNDDGKITTIGVKNINRIKGLIEGEIKKIGDARKTIILYQDMLDDTDVQKKAKLDFAMKNLIPGWHYDPKGIDFSNKDNIIQDYNFLDGNYRKFGFMNGFYNAYKNDIDGFYFNNNKSKDPFYARKEISNKEFDIDNSIDEYFTNILQEEVKELVEMTGSSEKTVYVDGIKKTMPRKGLFELQTNVIHKEYDINQNLAAADFLMDYLFHSIDLFNMFNGEIGMYKQPKNGIFNMMDALKRTSAVNADGIYANNPNPLEIAEYIPFGKGKPVKYFKNTKTIFAVIKAQKYDQSYYGEIINKLIQENGKGNYITLGGEVSDGASYGHPEFLFDFYRRTYGVSEEEEKLHKKLMNPKTIPTDKHFKLLKKLGGSNQPGKLQAFSIIKKNDGTRIPIFWKSSVFPLYPSVTKGFQIDRLREQMVKQNIGVVGNDSAFKSMTPLATKIFEDNNEDNSLGLMMENIDLNPFELDTADIKIQVELTSKGDKPDVLAGSQPLMNVIANMDLNSPDKAYEYKGESLTAKQMLAKYDDNIKNVVQFQLEEFLNDIEYQADGSYNEEMFRKIITKQLGDIDYDLKALLEDLDMPLETIPGMSNRIYPIISSFLEKNVSDPRTTACAAIQVANTGFNSLSVEERSNAVLFNKNQQLKPPRPTSYKDMEERLSKSEAGRETLELLRQKIETYNAGKSEDEMFDFEQSPLYFSSEDQSLIELEKTEGYYAKIEDGEIMIPFSSIFKNSGMSWEEFKAFAEQRDEDGNLAGIAQEILENLIGYRIPNQSVSSNDSFKIVGILPPSVGDSAIIYHEITAKTGSDFDIDKMNLMLPNFDVTYSKQDESKLSKANRNAIEEAVNNNSVYRFMDTDEYTSMGHVYGVLFRNEKLRKFADEERFFDQDDDDRIDFFVENKRKIERILERDFNKASNKRGYEFSRKDVLKDLYQAIGVSKEAVDNELVNKGFGPRNRLIAEKFEYISDNSEKGLQNNLIESMRAILKSSKTFDDLISPLDGTHIKDSINEIRYEYFLSELGGPESLNEFRNKTEDERKSDVNDFLKSKEKSLIASMMPKFLAGSRTDMLMAKQLTATMANHMTNIPLTQINKVFLKYNIGLESSTLSRTHIVGKEDLDEFKITKMVSYLMNASVDAAKDNYIIQGNYNRYTSGAAMLFVRLGIDPKEAAKILQHPLIVKLSKEKLGAKSKIADISASYTNEQLDGMAYDVAQKINNGLKIIPEAFMANIYEKGSKLKESEKIGLSDLDIIGFWHLAVSVGKDLNESIKLSKAHSKGAYSTISEFIALENLHKKIEGNSLASLTNEYEEIGGGVVFGEKITKIPDFQEKFETIRNESGDYVSGSKGNYVAAISNASVSLMNRLAKGKLIEMTPGYIELVNRVAINLGLGHTTDENVIKKLSANIYPYVLSTSRNEIYNFVVDKENDIDDIKDMLDTLPKDLLKIKSNEKYEGNAFLDEIYVDEAKGFISFNNVANYSVASKIGIKDAASTLYNDSETRELMNRMVKYSFFTTGFRPSSYSFASYLPKQAFIDMNHHESIKELLLKLNNREAYADSHLDKVMMFLASNRPEDAVINKKLKNVNPLQSGKQIKSDFMLKRVSYLDPDTKETHFYPFISIAKKNLVNNYALVDVVAGKKENEWFPVYESINVMQYKSDSKFAERISNDDAGNYSGEMEYDNDQTGPVDFSIGEKRVVDKKNRNSRLLLFDTNLATPEFLFKNNKKARLFVRETKENLHAYRGRRLFDLNDSEESKSGKVLRKAYLDGLEKTSVSSSKELEISEMKSNIDVYNALSKSLPLTAEEIAEYDKIIDYFYSQDNDANAKQKAVNELNKYKQCEG